MKRRKFLRHFGRLSGLLTVFLLIVGGQSKLFAIQNSKLPQSNNNNNNNNNIFLYENDILDNTLNSPYKEDNKDFNLHHHNANDESNDNDSVFNDRANPQEQQDEKISTYQTGADADDDVKHSGDNKGFVIIIDNRRRANETAPARNRVAIYYIKQPSKVTTPTTSNELIVSVPPTRPPAATTSPPPPSPSPVVNFTPYSATSVTASTPGDTRFHGWNGFYNSFGQLVLMFFGGNAAEHVHLPDYNLLFNADRHIVFQLHTAQTAQGSATKVHVEEVKLYNAASLRQSRFNPFNPTRILIHGWLGSSNANVYSSLIPAYLQLNSGNYNVFTVDWGRGAFADYITASYRVKPVAKVLAKFIDFLHREANMLFEDVHVVGFSMGAHVAGIAGKHLQTGRLPVIYALDPALPLFRHDQPDERVADSDADYVEVIHTSAGSYGYDRPLGHADFYVNWGSSQPGCFFNECSHFRAFQVFAESLSGDKRFLGQGCSEAWWQDLIKHRRCLMATGRIRLMGGDPTHQTMAELRRNGGMYYVDTNAGPPYAKGGS